MKKVISVITIFSVLWCNSCSTLNASGTFESIRKNIARNSLPRINTNKLSPSVGSTEVYDKLQKFMEERLSNHRASIDVSIGTYVNQHPDRVKSLTRDDYSEREKDIALLKKEFEDCICGDNRCDAADTYSRLRDKLEHNRGDIQVILLDSEDELPLFEGKRVWGHAGTYVTAFGIKGDEATENGRRAIIGRLFHEIRARSTRARDKFNDDFFSEDPQTLNEARKLARNAGEAFERQSEIIREQIELYGKIRSPYLAEEFRGLTFADHPHVMNRDYTASEKKAAASSDKAHADSEQEDAGWRERMRSKYKAEQETDYGFIDIPEQPDMKQLVRDMYKKEEVLGRVVPDTSDINKWVREILDLVAEKAEVDMSDFSYRLINTNEFNMYILTHEELEKNHIWLCAGMLRRLQKRYGRIKAGHIAFLAGHELGHYKEGHYDDIVKKKGGQKPGEGETWILREINSVKAYFLKQVFSRRQEELVDARGLKWMFELGFDPHEGIEVLELLKQVDDEFEEKDRAEKEETKKGFGIRLDIFRSHPMNDTRLQKARGVMSALLLENINRPAAARPTGEGGEELKDWRLKRKHLRPTRTQELMASFEGLFKKKDLKEFPWEEIRALAEKAEDPMDIAHIILIAQIRFALFKEQTPIAPYSRWMPDSLDMAQAVKGEGWYQEFLQNVSPLASIYNRLMDGKRPDPKDADSMKARWRFSKWFLLGAMYPGLEERVEEDIADVLDMLRENPRLAKNVLDDVGIIHIDMSEIDMSSIKNALDGFTGFENGYEILLRLANDEMIKLTKEIIDFLMDEGLTDNVQEMDDIIAAAGDIRKSAVDSGIWEKVSYSVGENLAIWAEGHIHTREVLAEFLGKLRTINPDAGAGSYEAVEIPVACLMLKKTGKYAASYDERKKWLLGTYKSSMVRDQLIFMLFEDETGFRQSYYGAVGADGRYKFRELSKEGSKIVGECYCPVDADEILDESMPAALDIFQYLDMSWFKVRMVRKDAMSYGRLEEAERQVEEDREVDRRINQATFDDSVPEDIKSNEDRLCSKFMKGNLYFFYAPTRRAHNLARDYLYPYLYKMMADVGDHVDKYSGELRKFYDRIGNNPYLQGIFAEIVERHCYYHLYDNQVEKGGVGFSFTIDEELNVLHQYILQLDGEIKPWILAHLSGFRDPFRGAFKNGILGKLLNKLPDSGIKDYLIARSLISFVHPNPEAGKSEFWKSKRELRLLMSHVRAKGDTAGMSMGIDRIADGVSHVARNVLWKIYTNYGLFLSLKKAKSEDRNAKVEFISEEPHISYYPLGYFNDLASKKLFKQARHRSFEKLGIEDKFREIMEIFRKPSNSRDEQLLKYVFNESDPGFEDFIQTETALGALEALVSPADKFYLGRMIYEKRLKGERKLRRDLRRHLELIKRTHPKGSPAREEAVSALINGGYVRSGARGYVETWDEVDAVNEMLNEGKATTTDEEILARSIGIGLIERALKDAKVRMIDKVNTILWLIGLKDKSHLVECFEIVYGKDADDYKSESDKLTSYEKELLIKEILSGEKGILKSDDVRAKSEFLNALFISVFAEAKGLNKETLRYFKSVFDTMLCYMSSDRAGEVMARFLTCHLEGQNFDQLVKLFFESFGFVGVKIAQYLVSNTGMIPESMKDVLMDLTSRVEGPDKRVVFDTAKSIYGEEAARRAIKRVKRKLGGGSLMIFYEVEVRVKDGRTKNCAVGILRNDIIQALPEDLTLVYRVIETMREKPEIFGYNTVSMDLMDNLTWQSMVETDLERTVNLQEKMASCIDNFMERKLAEPGVAVSMPHIMTDRFAAGDGEDGTIPPNQGPIIWMDMAEGETLDLYIKRVKRSGRKGQAKIKKIMTTIAKLAVHMLVEPRSSLVHADLHPGNILVKDDGEEIRVSIIDVGLGTEIDSDLQQAIQRLIRVMVGYLDVGEKADLERLFGDIDALKSALGLTKVSEEQGRQWIRMLLRVFEDLAGDKWPEEKIRTAEERIWDVITREGQGFQAKISDLMNIARDAGVYVPRQFYYVMRMFGVMDYIWKQVDIVDIIKLLKKLTTVEDNGAVPLDEGYKQRVIGRICVVLCKQNCNVDEAEVSSIFDKAKDKKAGMEKIRMVLEGIIELMRSKGIDEEERIEMILVALAKDEILRKEFGVETVERFLRGFASERDEKEAWEKRRVENALGRIDPLTKKKIKANVEAYEFGRLSRVWRIEMLHPGTMILQKIDSDSGAKAMIWVVTDIIPDENGEIEIENIEAAPLFEIFDIYGIHQRGIEDTYSAAEDAYGVGGQEEEDTTLLDFKCDEGENDPGSMYNVGILRKFLTSVSDMIKVALDLVSRSEPIPDRCPKGKARRIYYKHAAIDGLTILNRFLINNAFNLMSGRFENAETIGQLIAKDRDWQDNLVLMQTTGCTPFRDLLISAGETGREYNEALQRIRRERRITLAGSQAKKGNVANAIIDMHKLDRPASISELEDLRDFGKTTVRTEIKMLNSLNLLEADREDSGRAKRGAIEGSGRKGDAYKYKLCRMLRGLTKDQIRPLCEEVRVKMNEKFVQILDKAEIPEDLIPEVQAKIINIVQDVIHDENMSLWRHIPREKKLCHLFVNELIPEGEIGSIRQQFITQINRQLWRQSESNEKARILTKREKLKEVIGDLQADGFTVHVVVDEENRLEEVPQDLKAAIVNGRLGNYAQMEGVMAISRALAIENPKLRNERLVKLYHLLTGEEFKGSLSGKENPHDLARAIAFNLPGIEVIDDNRLIELNKNLVILMQQA